MNLLKAAATVSGLTFLSRITGLVRETLTASVFGAGPMTEAFIVAFRLPNLLRRLFAEGAFSQAFVPILAARRPGDGSSPKARQGAWSTRSPRPCSGRCWRTCPCMGVRRPPPILVWMMASSGLAKQPGRLRHAATDMTRFMFPYILFMSMVALLAAGILNTWKRFAVPAFTPVLLNVSLHRRRAGADALVLRPARSTRWPPASMHRRSWPSWRSRSWALRAHRACCRGIGLHPVAALRPTATSTTRRILKRMAPAVLAVSVAQLSLIVNTHIASRLEAGSVVLGVNYAATG